MNAYLVPSTYGACRTEHVYAGRMGLWVQRAEGWGSGCAVTLQVPDIIGKCFTRVCPDIIDGFPLEVHETVVDDVMYVERVQRTLLHDQDRVEDSDENEKRA